MVWTAKSAKIAMATCSCAKGHVVPSLDQISQGFQMDPGAVLNVYVVGSHMWGVCTSSSDWDLVIVLRQLKSSSKPQNAHRGSLDAFILSKEQYTDQLTAHSMQVLLTLWLPEQCILKQSFDPKGAFAFSQEKLIASLTASRDRDIRIAEKHFKKGDSNQAKKVLIHCIRYLDLGIQMKSMKKSDTMNYSSTNYLREQVLNNYSKVWETFMEPVQEVLDTLWSRLANP